MDTPSATQDERRENTGWAVGSCILGIVLGAFTWYWLVQFLREYDILEIYLSLCCLPAYALNAILAVVSVRHIRRRWYTKLTRSWWWGSLAVHSLIPAVEIVAFFFRPFPSYW